jgi:HAMP domain-containing protein
MLDGTCADDDLRRGFKSDGIRLIFLVSAGGGEMSVQRGSEMRKFLVAISVLTVLLVVAVVFYITLTSIRRIDREMDTQKERVVLQLVDYFRTSLEEVAASVSNAETMEGILDPDILYSTDMDDQLTLLQFFSDVQRAQYAADYLVYISGGIVLASSVEDGLDISEFPRKMPVEGYEVLSELGGREGTFISVFSETELSPLVKDEFLNFAVDRTEQIEELEGFYADEKSSLIKGQVVTGAIAVAITLLLTALGAYYLTRRYITAPIEELAEASHRIMEGTFEGDVEVVEGSDYADIQRLLQSGKILMDKMEEMGRD